MNRSPTYTVERATLQRNGYHLVVYRDGKLPRQATHFGPIAEGDRIRIVSGLAVKVEQ